MNLKDIVTFIVTDASVDSNSMNALISAINDRRRFERSRKTAIAKATLNIGDEITVSGIAPKYLNGMKGKITAFNKTRSRADIEIIDNRRDYRVALGAIRYGFPVQCLTPVASAVTPSALTEADSALLDFLEA